ncbi:MAG: hypothetical protein FWB85_01150 [Chitinispirillia bacterium]|nr:hypothetical protein [Chitinispirillia bacterium]MCL2241266.1 hypothetical protein [Chitinispirillia bacterium]
MSYYGYTPVRKDYSYIAQAGKDLGNVAAGVVDEVAARGSERRAGDDIAGQVGALSEDRKGLSDDLQKQYLGAMYVDQIFANEEPGAALKAARAMAQRRFGESDAKYTERMKTDILPKFEEYRKQLAAAKQGAASRAATSQALWGDRSATGQQPAPANDAVLPQADGPRAVPFTGSAVAGQQPLPTSYVESTQRHSDPSFKYPTPAGDMPSNSVPAEQPAAPAPVPINQPQAPQSAPVASNTGVDWGATREKVIRGLIEGSISKEHAEPALAFIDNEIAKLDAEKKAQREEDRDDKNRTHQSGQAKLNRDHQSDQAKLNREHKTNENALNRTHQEKLADKKASKKSGTAGNKPMNEAQTLQALERAEARRQKLREAYRDVFAIATTGKGNYTVTRTNGTSVEINKDNAASKLPGIISDLRDAYENADRVMRRHLENNPYYVEDYEFDLDEAMKKYSLPTKQVQKVDPMDYFNTLPKDVRKTISSMAKGDNNQIAKLLRDGVTVNGRAYQLKEE